MLLYKHIEISNWHLIKNRYLFLERVYNGRKDWIHQFNKQELAVLAELLPNSIVGQPNLKLKSALVFGQEALGVQGLHVDGYKSNRNGASNYALNIPIVSTGKMIWYQGDYILSESTANGVGYLDIKWNTEPTEIVSTIIDRPTIVKIDTPHQVINQDNNVRLLLSIRFTPDIKL